jgi:hypothetical protein
MSADIGGSGGGPPDSAAIAMAPPMSPFELGATASSVSAMNRLYRCFWRAREPCFILLRRPFKNRAYV